MLLIVEHQLRELGRLADTADLDRVLVGVPVGSARIRGARNNVEQRIAAVRRFNRFYTQRIGVLGVEIAAMLHKLYGAKFDVDAAATLLGSKDAVSRLVGRLADDFETWRHRDLAEDQIQYLLMDGWYPKVRIGKRRVRVPVLVGHAEAVWLETEEPLAPEQARALLAAAGVDRVITMTLHAPQVHGFFSVPVDHLHALLNERPARAGA